MQPWNFLVRLVCFVRVHGALRRRTAGYGGGRSPSFHELAWADGRTVEIWVDPRTAMTMRVGATPGLLLRTITAAWRPGGRSARCRVSILNLSDHPPLRRQ